VRNQEGGVWLLGGERMVLLKRIGRPKSSGWKFQLEKCPDEKVYPRVLTHPGVSRGEGLPEGRKKGRGWKKSKG